MNWSAQEVLNRKSGTSEDLGRLFYSIVIGTHRGFMQRIQDNPHNVMSGIGSAKIAKSDLSEEEVLLWHIWMLYFTVDSSYRDSRFFSEYCEALTVFHSCYASSFQGIQERDRNWNILQERYSEYLNAWNKEREGYLEFLEGKILKPNACNYPLFSTFLVDWTFEFQDKIKDIINEFTIASKTTSKRKFNLLGNLLSLFKKD